VRSQAHALTHAIAGRSRLPLGFRVDKIIIFKKEGKVKIYFILSFLQNNHFKERGKRKNVFYPHYHREKEREREKVVNYRTFVLLPNLNAIFVFGSKHMRKF
jgi:hypothetical protein